MTAADTQTPGGGDPAGRDATAGRDSWLKRLGNGLEAIWSAAAREADMVAAVLVLLGLALLALSFALKLHAVTFDGTLRSISIGWPHDRPMVVAKQVGYAWAPNWGITGFFLLPLTVYYLLLARRTVETTIDALLTHKMLVNADFSLAERSVVFELWRSRSRRWTVISSVLFLFSFAFIFFFDFIPVVAQFLLMSDTEIAKFVADARITLQHPDYEFDWSIASTFAGIPLDRYVNLAFSGAAYLIIPAFGASFLFAGFFWFFALCTFFSSLKERRILLIPDEASGDDRKGFEVFEPLFEYLVNASILTAIVAVSMHVQNVYLRAPGKSNIVHLLLGDDADDLVNRIVNTDLPALLSYVQSTPAILHTPATAVSLQTYVGGIAIFMVCVIVFFCVWIWLRQAARDGLRALRRSDTLDPDRRAALKRMKIWPVGWITLNKVIAMVLIVGLSMWFPVLLILVFAFFALRAIRLIIQSFFSRDDDID